MSSAATFAALSWAANQYLKANQLDFGVPGGVVNVRKRPRVNQEALMYEQVQKQIRRDPPAQHKHISHGEHTEKLIGKRQRGKGGRTRTKSKRRKKQRSSNKGVTGKTKKYVKRVVGEYMKFNHGPKMTIELYQKYFLNTASTGVTTGILNSAFEEQAHAFLPLFVYSQMTQEFRINEATGGAGSLGILDPPGQEIYSGGVKTAYTMNWVKNTEQIVIDSLTFRLYLSNTADTKMKLRINEWVCNDSSNMDPVARATLLYNQQRCFDTSLGYPNAGNIASGNLFKQPPFSMGMVPEFGKFWKKGSFHKTIELLPGESLEVVIPYKKIMWNQAAILKESDSSGPEEYQKGISRMIQLTTIGQVGYDASVAKVAAFQATQLNFQCIKKLTAHRMDTWGRDKKNYQLNFSSNETNFTYGGTAVTEAQVSVTGPVSSEFYATETTD